MIFSLYRGKCTLSGKNKGRILKAARVSAILYHRCQVHKKIDHSRLFFLATSPLSLVIFRFPVLVWLITTTQPAIWLWRLFSFTVREFSLTLPIMDPLFSGYYFLLCFSWSTLLCGSLRKGIFIRYYIYMKMLFCPYVWGIVELGIDC